MILRNDRGLLPLTPGRRVAVIGPHATAQQVLVQPYPFSPFCPDNTLDCIVSPADAIASINAAGTDPHAEATDQWTKVAPGCDLFFNSTANFSAALAAAADADYVVLALGIETCGMNPAHNVNPLRPGRCFQEKLTTDYVFPDQYTELEAHDRTVIDLPDIQHKLAAAVLNLGKPTVLVLFNGLFPCMPSSLPPTQSRDGRPTSAWSCGSAVCNVLFHSSVRECGWSEGISILFPSVELG